MSENRYGEKREESETGMKLQNCETQESENKVQESTNEQIKDMGQVVLNSNSRKHKVELLTIIGEVEGHESAPSHSKTTKYEHVLPKLAIIEDDEEIEGLLILLNTVGGDVEAGLAIAEMIASLSIPTVSLVLGGGHSIGVPMAVSADYSFAVPSATMVIHPVRSNGMFIGVAQTYRNMEKIQDRITTFISEHSRASQKRLEELMLDTSQLVKDVGTMLEGKEAVKEGLIDTKQSSTLSGTKYDDAIEAAAGTIISAGYTPSGIAMDPALSFGLSTMRDTTGRKIYPELGFGQNTSNFLGMNAAVSDTVSAKNEISVASKLLGIVGQFNAFRWGVQRSIGAHMIEYGDPDGLGDLQRQNQIAIRAEIVYGIGILDSNAFAKIVSGE